MYETFVHIANLTSRKRGVRTVTSFAGITLRHVHDPDCKSCDEIVEKVLLPLVLWQPVEDGDNLHQELCKADLNSIPTNDLILTIPTKLNSFTNVNNMYYISETV